jgi:PadR family transcriptional regulator AphA
MKHAILGLLEIAPMSGYDLKKNFDATIAHFWTADQSQIYRTLSGLVDGGLASVSVIEQRGKPNRNVHSITDAGRAVLDDWLRSPLEQEVSREPFLARLFFAGRMGVPQVAALLAERRAAAASQLAALSALQELETETSGIERSGRLHLAERLRLATLSNGIAHTQTELDWLDELTSTLAAAPAATP